MENQIFGQVRDTLQPHCAHLEGKSLWFAQFIQGNRPTKRHVTLIRGGSSRVGREVLGVLSGWLEDMKTHNPPPQISHTS